MTSAPRSASCMPTAPGPSSELSMMRTASSSPRVVSFVVIERSAYHVAAAAVTRSSEDTTARDRAAAVHREQRAGDELALPTRQVDHRVGDVVRLPEPGEVHRLELGAALGRERRLPPLVHHVADRDRVAADALAAIVDRDRARERVQATLAGDVRRQARARALRPV